VLLIAYGIYVGEYRYSLVCRRCAVARYMSEVRFFGLGPVLWSTAKDVPTPLSAIASSRGVTGECDHTWTSKHHFNQAVLSSERVVAFITNLADYGEPGEAKLWLERALQRRPGIRVQLEWLGFPSAGFDSSEASRKWWSESEAELVGNLYLGDD
jgi:hypothetical protein